MSDIQEIERKIDRGTAGAVALIGGSGGSMTIAPRNMGEMMEFAKLMAISGPCVRPQFRGSPGACLAIALQAFKWGADPFAVANKAFVTKNKSGEEQIAYEAQLIHAIVNSSNVLQKRLRPIYRGDGAGRSCVIVGLLKGEDEPLEYESPAIGKIVVKNSPLWTSDPDQQLFYYSSRAWARRHVPEILLGIYTVEEIRGETIEIESVMAGEMTPAPPRPRREDFYEPEPGTVYSLTDSEGTVLDFTTAAAAANAFGEALRDAIIRGGSAVEAVWFDNEPLLTRLRADDDEAANFVTAAYAEARAATKEKKPASPAAATDQPSADRPQEREASRMSGTPTAETSRPLPDGNSATLDGPGDTTGRGNERDGEPALTDAPSSRPRTEAFWSQDELRVISSTPREVEYEIKRYLAECRDQLDVNGIDLANGPLIKKLPRATREDVQAAITRRRNELPMVAK